METIYLESLKKINEIKKEKKNLENQLKIKIKIDGKRVTIKGSPLDEYESANILEAINFGFSVRKALELKSGEFVFRTLHIRSFTRRKNLSDVKSRIIGRQGKTKKTIEKLSDCQIIIKENEIGVIGDVESIDFIITALINLIRGAKQANIYKYLEKINKIKKEEYLGVKY